MTDDWSRTRPAHEGVVEVRQWDTDWWEYRFVWKGVLYTYDDFWTGWGAERAGKRRLRQLQSQDWRAV